MYFYVRKILTGNLLAKASAYVKRNRLISEKFNRLDNFQRKERAKRGRGEGRCRVASSL